LKEDWHLLDIDFDELGDGPSTTHNTTGMRATMISQSIKKAAFVFFVVLDGTDGLVCGYSELEYPHGPGFAPHLWIKKGCFVFHN
jgi:hypothetical protein